ncbi:hypothetical protein BGZ63DRAFT_388247 [Mariannaea sp. PMI_226]|nr:hypothetical protein BGZ63DRAFT_388247 [Mariannaea sp. PMI_226]
MSRTIDLSHALGVSVRLSSPTSASQSYIPSFTTGDEISGTISIAVYCDVAFENLHVLLTGEQLTAVRGAVPDKAHHQFLRMLQTLDVSILSNTKVLKKGGKHEFPFKFRLIDYLPISSCLHSVDDPLVRAAHLHLPPSLGDASIAGFGGKLRDDSAPPGCKIVYNIQAKLERINSLTGKRETIPLKSQKVRIKPSAGDVPLPELTLDPLDTNNTPKCEVVISRKGSGLLTGRLSVALQKPDCFWLPLRDPHSEIIRSATLTLTYIPGSQTHLTTSLQPPPESLPVLKSLKGQITATTLYTTSITQSSSHLFCLPTKKKDLFGRPLNFSDKVIHLPVPSPPKLQWVYNPPSSSPQLAMSAPELKQLELGQGYYTASLMVPVALGRENYVTTFYSCFISRVYSLSLQLEVSQAQSVPLKTIKVTVPIEIAAKRDPGVLPSYNASMGVVHTGL